MELTENHFSSTAWVSYPELWFNHLDKQAGYGDFKAFQVTLMSSVEIHRTSWRQGPGVCLQSPGSFSVTHIFLLNYVLLIIML